MSYMYDKVFIACHYKIRYTTLLFKYNTYMGGSTRVITRENGRDGERRGDNGRGIVIKYS